MDNVCDRIVFLHEIKNFRVNSCFSKIMTISTDLAILKQHIKLYPQILAELANSGDYF